MARLEEVRTAFESWRSSRQNKTTPIPESLWSMARSLVPYYKKSHIQRALRISGSQYKAYCLLSMDADNESGSSLIEENGFISGYFEPIRYKAQNEFCEITLQGRQKSLHIKTNMTQLTHILSLVEGYL